MGDLMAKCKGVLVIQHKNDISDSYINNGDDISIGEFIHNLIKPHTSSRQANIINTTKTFYSDEN